MWGRVEGGGVVGLRMEESVAAVWRSCLSVVCLVETVGDAGLDGGALDRSKVDGAGLGLFDFELASVEACLRTWCCKEGRMCWSLRHCWLKNLLMLQGCLHGGSKCLFLFGA